MVAKLTKFIHKQRMEDPIAWWLKVKKTVDNHLQEFYNTRKLVTEATEPCKKVKWH